MVAYRRCGAGGNVENCILKNCREFHDMLKGSYYGYFDHVSGLFLSCRDMYVGFIKFSAFCFFFFLRLQDVNVLMLCE